ncbi:MAG: hydroxyacid dehydrogenase [Pseudomonadota bacterium]
MADVVIAEFMDQAAVDDLSATHDVLYDPALVDDPERLAREVPPARGLIVRNRTQVRGPLLEAAGALRVVGRLGVGLDNIDVAACEARGIRVAPATGANDTAVAEYVVCAVMMLLRGAFQAREAMEAGEWPRGRLMGREVAGARLGLIGFGANARETALRARALGMAVGAHDPHLAPGDPAWAEIGARQQTLDALIAESDAISLHVPLTEATRGLIDAARLGAMKPGAVLVNAARGSLVDEGALAAALRSGHLGGAALDVFATEPLTAQAAEALKGAPNLVLTPHIAGVTAESNVRVSRVTAQNVRDALEQAS